jgi:hypothetical protein
VIPLTGLLRADGPVDLPLLVLPGLAEHGQQHDPPIRSTPVRDPGRNIPEPQPQLPHGSFQVIRPRAAEFAALLCEQPADLIESLSLSLSLSLSSQSRTSGSSSKPYSSRIDPVTEGEITVLV